MSGFAKNVPTTTIQLDKPRTIAFTLDALNRLEELTGTPLLQIELDSAKIVKKLDLWIWSGLSDEAREEITPAEIRGMIHLGNLSQMLGEVSSLITASIPDIPEGKTDPALPKEMVEAGTS